MTREQCLPELRRLPVTRTVPLPRSGVDAGVHVLRRFGAGDVGCGVLSSRHQFGGSVPEGYREEMLVLLPDALVEVEGYEDAPEANTFARIFAATAGRADELEAALRDAVPPGKKSR